MSALQTLIAAADGTTDEDAHVFVPVKAIRELQAWMPGEREKLTTNGAAAWAGVDAQELRDGPEHVQRAAMDEDIRQAAIFGSLKAVEIYGWYSYPEGHIRLAPYSDNFVTEHFNRSVRILRHFGLLVEHGDGVVSIRGNG